MLKKITVTLLTCMLIVGFLKAQNKDGELNIPAEFDYPYIFIVDAEITGNERTKERIILRELDFSIGDSIATFRDTEYFISLKGKRITLTDSSEISRRLRYSRENIINTSLFLIVDMAIEQINGQDYQLKIHVQERWYMWVFPVVSIDAPNFSEWIDDPDFDQLNQGIFVSHNNIFGLSHQASLIAYGGSSQKVGFGYYVPWVGNGQKVGLKMGLAYESDAVIEANSVNNERLMLFDKNSVEKLSFAAALNIRPGLYNYSTIRLSIYNTSISDSLYALSPGYLPDSAQDVNSANLYIDYAYDSRNSKAYPLKGNYMRGFVEKKGLGVLSHDVDYFFYGIDFHYYQQISKKVYLAQMVKAVNASSVNLAYSYKHTLTSNDNFLRGYDLNAIRGDKMYYFRGNVKYELIEPTIRVSKKKPDSKFRNVQYAFYANVFSDVGFVRDNYNLGNPYNNKMLYSWGVGVDFVSYYDLVMRIEYAFTSERTHGFFFGFGMPI